MLSEPVLSPASPSITVTLWADPGRDWGFKLALLDVSATETGWGDLETLIPHPGQTPGVIEGARVAGIAVGQLHPVFGYSVEPGRIAVWRATFTVTDFSVRSIELGTDTGRYHVYPESPHGTIGEIFDRIPIEVQARVEVIPAPTSLALLGLGAVVAAHRRRMPDRPPGPCAARSG